MTALFLVIYLKGVVGATFGPLPYDMGECLRRRAEIIVDLDRAYAGGRAREGTKREDWRVVCIYRDRAPALGEGGAS